MNLLGIDFPPVAVAIGSLMGAFIVGLGAGLGSQLGAYLFNKLWKHKLDKINKHSKRLINKIFKKRIVT